MPLSFGERRLHNTHEIPEVYAIDLEANEARTRPGWFGYVKTSSTLIEGSTFTA